MSAAVITLVDTGESRDGNRSACGEDLEYAPDFVALMQASVGKSEQQFGTAIIPAEPPDWHRIEHDALKLLQRSQDIRIMGLLTRAWTENEGLAGYAHGVDMLATALERHWDDIHPGLTVSGEYDPMQRVNAIAAFADAASLARSVRGATLMSGPGGHLSLREAVAILEGGDALAAGGYPGGSVRLRAELGQAGGGVGPRLDAVHAVLDGLARIRRVLETHLDATWMPSFAGIEQPLTTISAAASVRGRPHGVDPAEARPEAAAPSLQPAIDGGGSDVTSGGTIGGRVDVVRVLQLACDYLERNEPSHPAPMLIRRALRLLQMNFYEIVRELIPEGLPRVDSLAGTGRDDKEPSSDD